MTCVGDHQLPRSPRHRVPARDRRSRVRRAL